MRVPNEGGVGGDDEGSNSGDGGDGKPKCERQFFKNAVATLASVKKMCGHRTAIRGAAL